MLISWTSHYVTSGQVRSVDKPHHSGRNHEKSRETGKKRSALGLCKDPYFWNTTTVHKILDAPEHLGETINFKTWSKSYKDNRPRLNPPDKQLVFEHTHPAIIDLETWDIVRSMRENKRRAPRYGNPGLFSGVAYCADCGSKLYYYTRAIKNKWGTRYEGSYSCSEYRKDVQYLQNRKCTCHFIRESQLEQLVLEELWQLLRYIPKHEKQFARLVMDRSARSCCVLRRCCRNSML